MKKSGIQFIFLVLSTLLALIYSGASIAVLTVIIITLVVSLLQCSRHKQYESRQYAIKLSVTTLAIYIISSLFISDAFLNGQSFLLVDPLSYFEQLGLKKMDIDSGEYLFASYFLFHNVDVLHMLLLRALITMLLVRVTHRIYRISLLLTVSLWFV